MKRALPYAHQFFGYPPKRIKKEYENLIDLTSDGKTVNNTLIVAQNTIEQKKRKAVYIDPVHLALQRSKTKLFPFQIRAIRKIDSKRGMILSFDTGNGKTITSITVAEIFLLRNMHNNAKVKVYVVAPKSLVKNFQNALVHQYGTCNMDRYQIMTYHEFVKEERDLTGQMVIIDEAHFVRTNISRIMYKKLNGNQKKSFNSLRRKQFYYDPCHFLQWTDLPIALRTLKNCIKASKVVLMTATPVYNEPADIRNLLSLVKGKMIMSTRVFKKLHPNVIKKYILFQDIDKDDPTFPKVIERQVNIEMTKKYYNAYKRVEQIKSGLWENPWAFYGGVRQATLCLPENAKANWTIQKILQGEKTLVYSAFISNGLKRVQTLLKHFRIPYSEIIGTNTIKEREEAVRQLNENKVKVLFVSAAGGEGIDIKGIRNIILLESSWNRARELQVIGRGPRRGSHLHLPKSKRKVHVYRLILIKPSYTEDKTNSADQILLQITKEKMKRNQNFINQLK